MGGVDRVDQHLSDYPTIRKRGKRYYKKQFFHLVEYALWNTYILYKKSGGRLTHLDFRLQMMEKFLKPVDVKLPHQEAEDRHRALFA